MAWLYLGGLTLVVWAACGAVISVGRRLWTLDTTLRVHLIAAPAFAFCAAALHRVLAPGFDPTLRAVVMTGLVVVLDAGIVAPLFERSYAMFRSLTGTWLPFVAIFVASWAAGVLT